MITPYSGHRFDPLFASAQDIRDKAVMMRRVSLQGRALSPARRRLVLCLVRLVYAQAAAGDVAAFFLDPAELELSRADIARGLGRRQGLVPYDRAILRELVTLRWLKVRRRARPLQNWMPTGYELVYHFDSDVLWCLAAQYQRNERNRNQRVMTAS